MRTTKEKGKKRKIFNNNVMEMENRLAFYSVRVEKNKYPEDILQIHRKIRKRGK